MVTLAIIVLGLIPLVIFVLILLSARAAEQSPPYDDRPPDDDPPPIDQDPPYAALP